MQTNPAVEQNKYLPYDIFANLMDRVTGRRDESVTFASLHENKKIQYNAYLSSRDHSRLNANDYVQCEPKI